MNGKDGKKKENSKLTKNKRRIIFMQSAKITRYKFNATRRKMADLGRVRR